MPEQDRPSKEGVDEFNERVKDVETALQVVFGEFGFSAFYVAMSNFLLTVGIQAAEKAGVDEGDVWMMLEDMVTREVPNYLVLQMAGMILFSAGTDHAHPGMYDTIIDRLKDPST